MNNEQYIKRCIELAEKGKGRVSPNPLVGAVLVCNGRVIGEGWHEQYGAAHAEVNCLNSVKEEDKPLISKSTMYVSLEPCAHHGNTPPCADRLVKEHVKRVVIANRDPFVEVDGKGLEKLNNAAIDTTTGVLEKEGNWLNRRFFCYHEQKRPYIILKWAQTTDGFVAPENGERFQITNISSQQLVHKWRTEEDAIMVGYNTAKNDDPSLTARLWKGKNPLRLVIDRHLVLPKDGKLFNDDALTWVLNSNKEGQEGAVKYIQLNFESDIIPQLIERLYNTKVQSMIIEGGAVLLDSFIEAGLWDEARVFTGNKVLNKGILAPQLKQLNPVLEKEIVGDVLHVYVNPDSKYEYVKGGEL